MEQDFLVKVEGLALCPSLGEMFRDFQLLLNSMQNEVQPVPIAQILSAFQPETDLHKFFKVKIVDQFKCVEVLEDMLRSEDSLYATKVLRCSWYFEDIDDVHSLVNEAFPCMSFFTRTKVIGAYARNLKDSRKAEEMFLALRERYGLSKAVMILPACSEKFVRNLLRHIHVQLPARTVLALYDKYPSLVIEFITFLLDHSTEYNRAFRNFDIRCYGAVFAKMAGDDTKTFMSLYEQYHANVPYMKLGRKIIKKFIKTNVTALVEKFKIYSRILQKKILVKYLSTDHIKQIQLSTFPKTMTEFFKSSKRDTFVDITSGLTEEIAQDLLWKNFEAAFGRRFSVDDFVSVLPHRMVGFLPVQDRAKWVESALKGEDNVKNQAEYISELVVADSFPRLKKLAQNQSDLTMRVNVLRSMIVSVRKHKSLDYFDPVIGYIVERYRNDQQQVRIVLFDEVSKFDKLLLEITDSGWAIVIDLVNQARLNNEVSRFLNYMEKILSRRIHAAFIKNQEVESHLNFFCEVVLKEKKFYSFDLCKDTPYHKQCLEWFIAKFHEMQWGDISARTVSLFVSINLHNASSKDQVAIPNWLIDSIEGIIKHDTYFCHKRSIIDAAKHNAELKCRIYDLIFPTHCEIDVLTFVLRRRPLDIKANKAAVIRAAVCRGLPEFRGFIRRSSLYSPFGVPQALIEECQVLLNYPVPDKSYTADSKPNAIKILSLLMRSSDFFHVAQKFAPASDRIGDYTKEVADITRMQEAVAASFKNVSNPSQFLVLLRQFAKGDYLKFSVGAILSVTLKIPEKIILPQIVEWLDCPVSLRKHFIRNYSAIAPIECTGQLLVCLFEKEKNLSIRLVLFSRMFSLFGSEPNEDTFKALKSFLVGLTSDDQEIMKLMFDLKKVPDQYIAQYLEMLWEVIGLKGDTLGSKGRNEVIDLIDKEILRVLPEEFCGTLLKHIFSRENIKNHSLFNFPCNYLLYNDDDTVQQRRLATVFEHIKNAFFDAWNEYTLSDYFVFPARKTLAQFIKKICTDSFKLSGSPLKPLNLLTEFKSKLSAVFNRAHLLEEFVLLDFTIFYLRQYLLGQELLTPNVVAQFLDTMTNELVSFYGPLVIYSVKDALPMHLLVAKDQIMVSEILLTQFNKESSHLLAVHLLPQVVNQESCIQHYEIIIASIMRSQYESVQLLGNRLLKMMSSSVRVT